MNIITILSNGKKVHVSGKEIDRDDVHEIIIRLVEAWGTDDEKEELRRRAGQGKYAVGVTGRRIDIDTKCVKLTKKQAEVMKWVDGGHQIIRTSLLLGSFEVNGKKLCNLDTIKALEKLGLIKQIGQRTWYRTEEKPKS